MAAAASVLSLGSLILSGRETDGGRRGSLEAVM